jgi:cell wall-associated NlpC family hydrolase
LPASPGAPREDIKPLPIGYSVQGGAFRRVENAARLSNLLQREKIPATYFLDQDGLVKVRFGNYRTRSQAEGEASALKSRGLIEDYRIIDPGELSLAQASKRGISHFRSEIVKTAHTFLGLPYLWGGKDLDQGFDCSGFTLAVYQISGLELPRSSQEQFQAGKPVAADPLPGDLLFFATRSPGIVSHVGIYIGEGRFIHASGAGKTIRIDILRNSYFRTRFHSARSFLD